MTQINVTSILRISLVLATLWLTACGSDDSSPPEQPPNTAESSTWGEMKWGEGKWGK